MITGNRFVRYTPEFEPTNLDTSANLYSVRTVNYVRLPSRPLTQRCVDEVSHTGPGNAATFAILRIKGWDEGGNRRGYKEHTALPTGQSPILINPYCYGIP